MLGFFASILLSPSLTLANEYPVKPITLVVPSPPGGNLDITARALSIPLSKALGQNVMVDNRGGGGGAVGAGSVARSPADGYTILLSVPGFIVTVSQLVKTPYSKASFSSVGMVSKTSVILVTRANDSRIKSFEDYVKIARNSPGTISAAHPGAGTPNHQALLQLEDLVGAQLNVVAYRGSGPALLDVVGGHTDSIFDQVTSSMSYIKAGTLKPIVILGNEREQALRDVPTISELGFGKIDGTTYVGIFSPTGTPAPILKKLTEALRIATKDEAFVKTLSDLGSKALSGPPEQLDQLLSNEEETAKKLIQRGRLKAE